LHITAPPRFLHLRVAPRSSWPDGKTSEAATRVQCITCHRGVAIPKQLADILSQTAADKGGPAAVAQYKDLRKQYFNHGLSVSEIAGAWMLPAGYSGYTAPPERVKADVEAIVGELSR
jgi:hypothetical protein